jgi:glycosyltransferase involved in cell wall biosynthesis
VKPEHCFAAGNPDELRQAMRRALERGWSDRDRTFYAGLLRERYDWDAIAARTAEVFASCLDKG